MLQGPHGQPLRPAASLRPQLRLRGHRQVHDHQDCHLLVHAGHVRRKPSRVREGDLPGIFDSITVSTTDKTIYTSWADAHYPTAEETTPSWNMILHAVCGSTTPRLACTVGREIGAKAKNMRGGVNQWT